MEVITKDSGTEARRKEWVFTLMLTEIPMKENGSIIRKMEKESTSTKKGSNAMKEDGKMDSLMTKEYSFIRTDLLMRESGRMEEDMEKVC